MGEYKVPQNVETEDKILGPLSVKQFIYVIIALMWGFLMWRIFSFSIIVALIFAFPVTGFFLLLGFGSREGVPFEDYMVAFFRFLVVPRTRTWIKDDKKEVIVKDVEKPKENLEKDQSVSVGQLKQLASIIDTRGNFKDPSVQLHEGDNEASIYAKRIIGPQQVGTEESSNNTIDTAHRLITPKDDVLDETSQRANTVEKLLQNAKEDSRQNAATQVRQALRKPNNSQPSVNQVPQQLQTINPAASQVAMQGSSLTIQQVATRANQQTQQLSPGTSAQVRQ